jgi:CheY-like chemotaxis protein
MTKATPALAPLILVVDDVEDARTMYALYLSAHGYRVIDADDGERALRLTLEQRPALVVMDMGLPKMDGWEATRRIKADPGTRHIPVLGVSGHAVPDSVQRAHQAGVDAFFAKPCLPGTVLAKIRELLGSSSP